MKHAAAFLKDDLLAAIPALRAFALSLSGKPDRADDLVQETLVKAWANMGSFLPGTNLRAWLFTIQRNIFYSQYRKLRREVEDVDGHRAGMLSSEPSQPSHMDFQDFRKALAILPVDQREALMLIGATGLSYEEAAVICDCAIGTIKSRVNRGRAKLAELLGEGSKAACGHKTLGMIDLDPTVAQGQEGVSPAEAGPPNERTKRRKTQL